MSDIPVDTALLPAREPWVRVRSVVGLWGRHVLSLVRVWKVAATWFVVEPGFVLVAVALGVGRLVGTMETGESLAAALGWMPLAAWPGLFLVSVGVGLVFGGIGLLFAALSPTIHALTLVFTVVATPLYFFSGSFFPVEVLPDALEPVAWAAPLTPLVHLGRAFTTGSFDASHALAAAYTVVLVAALVPLNVALMRRRLLR